MKLSEQRKTLAARRILPPLVLVLVAAGHHNAHVRYGSVVGKVMDPSQAAVPGAKMGITNTETNQSRETTTKLTYPGEISANYYSQGAYRFDRNTLDTKVNWNATSKISTYLRFSYLDYDMDAVTRWGRELLGSAIAGGNPGAGYGNTYSVMAALTYVLTPSLIFDTNFGYTLMDTNVAQYGIERNVGLEVLGIPGTNGKRPFEGAGRASASAGSTPSVWRTVICPTTATTRSTSGWATPTGPAAATTSASALS